MKDDCVQEVFLRVAAAAATDDATLGAVDVAMAVAITDHVRRSRAGDLERLLHVSCQQEWAPCEWLAEWRLVSKIGRPALRGERDEDAALPVSWRRWTPVIQRARR